MRRSTGVRLAAFVCALALLMTGCSLLDSGSTGEVTVHFSDGQEYSFTGTHADWLTRMLRSLEYDESIEDDVETSHTVDTIDAAGYRINTHDGFVCQGNTRAWMRAEQTSKTLAILDWAYARLPKQTTTTTESDVSTPEVVLPDSKKITDVPIIDQRRDFPTGCESTAAVMALQYAGANVTVAQFVDRHLEKSYDFSYKNGQKYGPSPYEYFLGNPRTTNAYGCMAPVIQKALVSALGGAERVQNASGKTMEELCAEYIVNGIPVIVWATIEMREPTYTDSWILPDGSTYTWPNDEHCLLLTGYDKERYYFNDPYTGRARSCLRSIGEVRYTELGSQALVVLPEANG